MSQQCRWHPARIRAEVSVKGKTLTSLAVEAGLSEAACRKALARRHVLGERAIARFLGIALWSLWPDRWTEGENGQAVRIDNRFKSRPAHNSRPRRAGHRQKEVRA